MLCWPKSWPWPRAAFAAALRRAVYCLCAVAAPLASPADPASAAPDAHLRVVTYNLFNYVDKSGPQIKSPESRDTALRILAALAPDLAVLIETGSEAAVLEIRDELAARGHG